MTGIAVWLALLSLMFFATSLIVIGKLVVMNGMLAEAIVKPSEDTEKMKALLNDIIEKTVVNGQSIDNLSYLVSKFRNDVQLSKSELRGAVDNLDSTLAGMHNTVNVNYEQVKKCMTGIDENTRKIYGDLIVAVEKNDIAKLADVVRASKAFVENYDAVRDASMNPFSSKNLFSSTPLSEAQKLLEKRRSNPKKEEEAL